MYPTCTTSGSQHRNITPDGARNFSPKAPSRAIPVVDLDLRRLTLTGIPPVAWQMLDQCRWRDLDASRAEDREPTMEVADAEAASVGAPFASRQPARGSVDPRHYTPLNGHVGGTAVRVERLPT